MPFVQHPPVETDVLQMQFDPLYNKKKITLQTGGENYTVGTVLGMVSANGEYTDYDGAASDGTETAVAVLAANYTDGGSNVDAVAWVRGPAIFADTGLTFKATATAQHITDAKADLDALGLVVVAAG